MMSMSKRERAQLCDLALQVGEDAPTLSGEWTVKDLVVHLLVREGSPTAIGVVVRPLSKLMDITSQRLGRRDLAVLVEKLRTGPPFYSGFAVPGVDARVNTLEFFVHHEDIRRARADWEPRHLDSRDESLLWKQIGVAGRLLVRGAPVGVTIERSDRAARTVLKRGASAVVVKGKPSEVTLYLYGRKPQADVELLGTSEDVAALEGKPLGL